MFVEHGKFRVQRSVWILSTWLAEGVGHETKNDGGSDKRFGDVDLGRLRILAWARAFSEGANVRRVAEWT